MIWTTSPSTTSDAALLVDLETETPITGTGSLRMAPGEAASRYVNAVASHGPESVRLGSRALSVPRRWLRVWRTAGLCLQSVAGRSDEQWRGVSVRLGDQRHCHAAPVAHCALHDGSHYTHAPLRESPFAWDMGVPMALECSWLIDLVTLGGIRFSVKRGAALDFSDLADVAGLTNLLATTDLLTTSVGEGPAWWGGATLASNYLWDSMRCVPLLVG